MLRRSRTSRIAAFAAALLISTSSLAQGSGLADRIADAGKKLQSDTQACKPINIGEYAELLREAGQNKIRADKAKAKGVPVDETQVQADLANASALVNQAQAAVVQQCMRAATGQQPQVQPQATPTPTPTPATAPAPAGGQAGVGQAGVGGGQGTAGTNSAIDTAETKLDADIKACKPINPADYEALADETRRNARLAFKAALSGAPVDANKLNADMDRADKLLERARKVKAQQDACPPKREATTEPPPATGGTQGAFNLNPFERTFFDQHNALRASYGVAPLEWSPALTARAAVRSVQNAEAGQLVHGPRDGRKERENISQVPISYTDEQSIGRWIAEDFVSGFFPNVCQSGDWQTCAHKSQMLSPLTQEVGCAKAKGGASWWIVCLYFPGGNKDGTFIGRRPDNYVEKVATAPNTTIRARPVGGDYGVPDQAALPDPNAAGSGRTSALNFMINGMLDFGDDDGVSGFVGGGVGVARIDYNNVRAFSNQGALLDNSDTNFAWQIIAGLKSPPDPQWVAAVDQYFKTVGPYDGPPGTATDAVEGQTPSVSKLVQVRQDWGAQQISEQAKAGYAPGQRTSLFDLGIYGGGAWSANWFDTPAGSTDNYSGSGVYWDPVNQVTVGSGPMYVDLFDAGFGLPGAPDGYQPTNVEPPTLPKGELSDPNAPKEPLEPL